ncbi:uncharacterized protein BX664DRAFT_321235 [Halteromyces radiatus]|uniref:uncharacterized protein n=1 Tax=Halteromyces radiatus TaxID=101107 RepID=UPI00221F38BB|nr:uncharacterized protein BX664DRAFT_321235 [Halteromyces radiatus]KAI8099433.1 hypothetical protein BX664DRAFT_321235 [Halteromyces radiatus]
MSGRMWSKSRQTLGKKRTAIPTILGTFTGLAFGGLLGMSQGMKKIRQELPKDSQLLSIIEENEQLKREEMNQSLGNVLDHRNQK